MYQITFFLAGNTYLKPTQPDIPPLSAISRLRKNLNPEYILFLCLCLWPASHVQPRKMQSQMHWFYL